jgi:hypothetical protein
VNTFVNDARSKIESGRMATRWLGGSSTAPAPYRMAWPTAACVVITPSTTASATAPA